MDKIYFSGFIFTSLSFVNPTFSHESSKLNVVFILADDLGWAQTGAYGSRYYSTPNIDRLASEGIRFTNAYSAAAICSPTRASIMTGKYPARLHLTDFIPGDESNKDRLLKQPQWQMFLPLEETTIAEVFRSKGYRTALFGKWHLSREKFGPQAWPHYPDKQGFDEYFVIDKPDSGDDPEADAHKSDSIGNSSVRFIHKNAGKPFFLFASFSAIHRPLLEKADSITAWKSRKGSNQPENHPVIGVMMARMDSNIGKILGVLDELNLEKNTLVLFCSDNGGLEADAIQTPLRSGKGWLYEGGIRVPVIVRWPGIVGTGRVSDEPIVTCDFMPTFCELTGSELPSEVDGISLLPLLKDEKSMPVREIYWHYPHYHGTGMTPGGAIRSGKWKLIEYYEKSLTGQNDAAYELYDLEQDLGERNNMAGTLPALKSELAGKLESWRKKTGAQMPVIK